MSSLADLPQVIGFFSYSRPAWSRRPLLSPRLGILCILPIGFSPRADWYPALREPSRVAPFKTLQNSEGLETRRIPLIRRSY
jgi:hypothetical protein